MLSQLPAAVPTNRAQTNLPDPGIDSLTVSASVLDYQQHGGES
jgi:hypothetical protein